MRTFATVTFPANLLLKREEVETGKIGGRSIIAALRHGKGEGRKTFIEAPFDLMYGFRGHRHAVDLLSPFEMLRYWSLEKVVPPVAKEAFPTAEWTLEGLAYKARCKARQEKPRWEAGIHYVPLKGPDRILLANVEVLGSLPFSWF